MKISSYNLFANTDKNITFVFVSDLHGYDNYKILDKIDKIAPNAVLVGGDMVHDDKNYKDGIEFLRLCSVKYPTFCALGNHEMKLSVDIRAMIRESGATLLDNEFTEYMGIKIGGLSTGYQSHRDAYAQCILSASRSPAHQLVQQSHCIDVSRYTYALRPTLLKQLYQQGYAILYSVLPRYYRHILKFFRLSGKL